MVIHAGYSTPRPSRVLSAERLRSAGNRCLRFAERGCWQNRPWPERTRRTQQVATAGLVLFTDRHYSLMYVEGPAARAGYADARRPTDAEKIAAFDSFVGHTGWYAVATDYAGIHSG